MVKQHTQERVQQLDNRHAYLSVPQEPKPLPKFAEQKKIGEKFKTSVPSANQKEGQKSSSKQNSNSVKKTAGLNKEVKTAEGQKTAEKLKGEKQTSSTKPKLISKPVKDKSN